MDRPAAITVIRRREAMDSIRRCCEAMIAYSSLIQPFIFSSANAREIDRDRRCRSRAPSTRADFAKALQLPAATDESVLMREKEMLLFGHSEEGLNNERAEEGTDGG